MTVTDFECKLKTGLVMCSISDFKTEFDILIAESVMLFKQAFFTQI